MKLKDYINKYHIDKDRFAKKVGTTAGYLNLLIYQHRRPGPALAKKIEKASKFLVTFRELLLPDE